MTSKKKHAGRVHPAITQRLALPVCPPLAHIPSLHRAKQGGRVYHFELRSNKHRLRLQVCFFGGCSSSVTIIPAFHLMQAFLFSGFHPS